MQEAHRREKPDPLPPNEVPNQDIDVSESFVREHEPLLLFCAYALVQAAAKTAGVIDSDVLDALDAEIRTLRTSQSGLLYESKPENFVARDVQRLFSASLADYEKELKNQNSLSTVRTSDLLATLVFLHRVGIGTRNGRPRGRMFLDLMRQMTAPAFADQKTSGIII